MNEYRIKYWGLKPEDNISYIPSMGMRYWSEILMKKKFNNGVWKKIRADSWHSIKVLDRAQELLDKRLKGIGADMGSGAGTLATAVSRYDGVKKIFAVESSLWHVVNVIPKTIRGLKLNPSKIVGCFGSFDRTQFPDNHLDFVVELGSFHHTNNSIRDVTLKEMRRILKPGGIIIAIERSREDSIMDDEIHKILSKKMDKSYNERYGFPVEMPLTRLDWGEHEYRQKEWIEAFEGNKFNTIHSSTDVKQASGNNFLICGVCNK